MAVQGCACSADLPLVDNEDPKKANIARLESLDYASLHAQCASRPAGSTVDGVRCCGSDALEDQKVGRFKPSLCQLGQQEFRAQYGNRQIPAEFAKVLQIFSNSMHSIQMPWHIWSTTLLSWHLHCTIQNVFDDRDLHIAIMEDDWNTEAINAALLSAGFRFVLCNNMDRLSWELVYAIDFNSTSSSMKDIPTAIVRIQQMAQEDHFTWMGSASLHRHLRWPKYKIIPAVYEGIPIGIPDNVEEHLYLQFRHPRLACPNYRFEDSCHNELSYLPRMLKGTKFAGGPHVCTIENRGIAP